MSETLDIPQICGDFLQEEKFLDIINCFVPFVNTRAGLSQPILQMMVLEKCLHWQCYRVPMDEPFSPLLRCRVFKAIYFKATTTMKHHFIKSRGDWILSGLPKPYQLSLSTYTMSLRYNLHKIVLICSEDGDSV